MEEGEHINIHHRSFHVLLCRERRPPDRTTKGKKIGTEKHRHRDDSTRMNRLGLLILAAVYLAHGYGDRCWSSGNGGPARWWNEGERIDRGKFWYTCHKGQLQGQGCFGQDGERLEIGGSYDAGGYEVTCTLGADGYLTFKYSACISNDGQRRLPGETWADPAKLYYFTCVNDREFLKITPGGCYTHDKQGQLKIGERYDYGEYTYECNVKKNGSLSLCSVGCVHEGKHFKIGDQWHQDDFVFYCKLNKGRCQKRSIGCVYEGKSLYDGDRYRDGETVYQCEIRQDSYGQKPVGCVSRDRKGLAVDRVIGCRWYLQTSDSKIEQTCEMDGGQTKVVTAGCIYRYHGYDTVFLTPNSYTVWNLPQDPKKTVALACKPTSYGAELETFDVNRLHEVTTGMKYEFPRGK